MKNLLPLLLSSLLALSLAGCKGASDSGSGTASGTTSAGGAGGEKKVSLAFVTNNASDFWTIARKGVEKAKGELPGVEVDFVLPDEGTAAQQRQKVDDLLSKGVQGIAISPVDPANETDLLNKVAEKAVLFTQDSDAPDSKRMAYVGTDNMAAGRQAGEELKKALPNGGKVMIFVGKSDAQNASDRINGLREALKGSNLQILDVRTDDTDRARAKSNVSDTLTKTPDIAGLVGIWSYNGPAIVSAVKDAGKTGQVKIVAFDEEADTLAGVKSGAIAATIVQQPYEFGYRSVKLMAQVVRGDKSGIPAEKKIFVPTQAITSANVDEFSTKLAELRK